MAERTNHASHWVSRVIDTEWPVSIDNPLLASVVWFGTVPNASFLLVVTLRHGSLPTEFLVAMLFGVVWLNIGPALIWYYDERVLPTFFDELGNLIEDDAQIERLSEKYDRLFATHYWIPTTLWVFLLVALFIRAQPFLASAGLFETGGVWYVVYLGTVVWLGIFTGIGFMGVITTVLAIRDLSTESLEISPLHPDGLGGLSVFGYYAIRTTLTFSTGSLLLPLGFIFIRATEVELLIYLIVVAYMGAIALSFLYPTYKINRQARQIRDQKLDRLRREYALAKENLQENGIVTAQIGQMSSDGDGTPSTTGGSEELSVDTVELVGQLELQRLRTEYDDYQHVRLYPFQVDILLKLASSILLPLAFVLVDHFVGQAV